MQQQNQLQQQNYQRMLQLQQPEISFLQGVTAGGPETTAAAMPFISQISQGFESSQQQIRNTIPPGAGRDFALSQLEEQKDTSTANFLNQQVLSAFDKLANIGSGLGSFSLQELGASLSAGQQGSESNAQVAKMEQAASPWNAISSLIGDVTSMFSFNPFSRGAAPAGGGGGGGAYV